jgi:hypothetical protein
MVLLNRSMIQDLLHSCKSKTHKQEIGCQFIGRMIKLINMKKFIIYLRYISLESSCLQFSLLQCTYDQRISFTIWEATLVALLFGSPCSHVTSTFFLSMHSVISMMFLGETDQQLLTLNNWPRMLNKRQNF